MSGNTWITCNQLPSLATYLNATSTAWKPKETNTGEVVHGQELLIGLNEAKEQSYEIINYQPWVLQQSVNHLVKWSCEEVSAGIAGTLKLHEADLLQLGIFILQQFGDRQ